MPEFFAKEPERLDRLLREQDYSPWLSRSAWEALLSQGKVKVDGRICKKAGEQIASGTRVQVELPALGLLPQGPAPTPVWLSSDRSFGVFNKEVGLPSHPLLPWETDTFANRVAFFVVNEGLMGAEEFAQLSAPPILEGGLVHRLDTDTSGLLSCAFTSGAKAKYRQLFSGSVNKGYLALVTGDPVNLATKAKVIFFRSSGAKVRAALEGEGEAVEFRFRVISRSSSFGLVEVHCAQGLRHVVRAGLAALGFPLVGDTTYGGSLEQSFHQLHAHHLEIPGHPEIGVSPPQTFLDCAAALGLNWQG